jgi:hypothetical protein
MESAALLIRSGKDTPERRGFLDAVMKRSGMQPIVSSILVEEPWEKGLRALIQIVSEPDELLRRTSGRRNKAHLARALS